VRYTKRQLPHEQEFVMNMFHLTSLSNCERLSQGKIVRRALNPRNDFIADRQRLI
jgi:hypothetical protein